MSCPACGGAQVLEVTTLHDVPVQSGTLLPDEASAVSAPRASLALVTCWDCGHVWNSSFDPSLVDYDAGYDNSLHWSPTFDSYAVALAERLRDRFGLRGRSIVEIGCGKGDFLAQLASGGNRVHGFDPTFVGEPVPGVTVTRDYFRASRVDGAVDFVCARHVLEHVQAPDALLSDALAAAGDGETGVYVEVPNGDWNFAAPGPWDFIYGHVGYFTLESLVRLLRRAGLHVHAAGTAFGDQFLYAEASTSPPVSDSAVPAWSRRDVAADADRQRRAVESARARLQDLMGEGRRVVLWGAGSKGVSYLAAVDPERQLTGVVDVNPAKWGRFVPVSGHRVESPEAVANLAPDVVLLTNPAYRDEIASMLAGRGVVAEVLAA